MQEKLSITGKQCEWEFPVLRVTVLHSTSAASELRKQSPSRPEIPICTAYQLKIVIILTLNKHVLSIYKVYVIMVNLYTLCVYTVFINTY